MNARTRNLLMKTDACINLFRTKNTNYWKKIGDKEMLRLFREASTKVPAYRNFLKKNRVNPNSITSIDDYKKIPPISKANYLHINAYTDLLWGGEIKKPITIHSTSGSTGEPTYFMRDSSSDTKRELIIDNFLKYNKLTISGPTLFIVTFGMGVWSAGMGIYTATYLAINKNKYPISLISPGINKIEVLKILRNIASNYKQIIIAGYPPFVKDIIDDAIKEGIDLKKFKFRFIFTGEAITEEFRDYICDRTGIENVLIDTMNTYGTSEFGATAVETPLSIFIKRSADKKMLSEIFGDSNKFPTLAQYIPSIVNFECINGELFLTGDGTAPLIRYELGDNGGIITYSKVYEILKNNNIDIEKEMKKLGISKYMFQLPFVYVFERKNLAVTLYSALIYPEFIKATLLDNDLNKFLTGKFTMIQKLDKKQNQYLEVNLELKSGVNINDEHKKIAMKKIVDGLYKRSSEFRELKNNLGKRILPKLVFWPYEYREYFLPGSKQRWVKKI